jgi:hypothetical protein
MSGVLTRQPLPEPSLPKAQEKPLDEDVERLARWILTRRNRDRAADRRLGPRYLGASGGGLAVAVTVGRSRGLEC